MKSQLMKIEVERISKAMELRDDELRRIENAKDSPYHRLFGHIEEQNRDIEFRESVVLRLEGYISRHCASLSDLACSSVSRIEWILG